MVPVLAADRQPRPADDLLAAAITTGAPTVVCQLLAGLGGVGKTQLAANLADQLWRTGRLDLLLWATATDRAGVLASYAQTAQAVTGIDDPDPHQAATRLLAWLAGTDKRWLIVLDDLADPAHLTRLWPPHTATGRTVVTTRRRDRALLDRGHLIDVGVFTPDEATAYLHQRLGDDPHRLDQAGELAADLGHLPLALAQVATYIRDQDLTCTSYRTRLAKHQLNRLHPRCLPDDQHTPVVDTWALSTQLADADTDHLAGIILQLAAILDPNGIPTSVFTHPTATGYYEHRLGRTVDTDDAHDTLRALHRLSLAEHTRQETTHPHPTAAGQVLRVHALVQRAIREATLHDLAPHLAATAADILLALWPQIENDAATTRLGQRLRANTTALIANTGDHLWRNRDGDPTTHPVLFRAATSLGEIGLVTAARDHYHRLHTTTTKLLGPDHPDTLTSRNHLARWQGAAGDPAGAVAAFEQLLTDRLRVLGPDHPATLTTRNHLAWWRGHAGDPAGAAIDLEQLLTDRLRVLGPNNSDTLITRGNLARWRGEAGDPAGAVAAFEQLLTDRLRVLGPDHPRTLTTRHDLAYWRGQAGDPTGAATALEQLLTDQLRVLGPDHPDTLTTRHNLARWRGEAGDPTAATALEQLLIDRLRVLGPDHPDTLTTRHHLAYWRGEAGA